MRRLLFVLATLAAFPGYARGPLPFVLRCAGSAGIPGIHLVVTSQPDGPQDTLVQYFARENGSPIGTSHVFIVTAFETASPVSTRIAFASSRMDEDLAFSGGALEINDWTHSGIFRVTSKANPKGKIYRLQCTVTRKP